MSDRLPMDYYKTLEKFLTASSNSVALYLSEQEQADVKSYIDHAEYGVAWELLWYLVQERRSHIPPELIECGEKMGFDTQNIFRPHT